MTELPPAGLVDTSVFIANESGRRLGALPDRVAVSVITVGELELGVLNAADAATRARRGDTLALVRTAQPVPVTESTMGAWARLVVDCRRAGVHRAIKLTDALIAATAIDLGLPVVTQDDDYGRIASAHPLLQVLRV
ncbi:MAG: PIN domain-containing protein [Acidimicrobiales bacterium]